MCIHLYYSCKKRFTTFFRWSLQCTSSRLSWGFGQFRIVTRSYDLVTGKLLPPMACLIASDLASILDERCLCSGCGGYYRILAGKDNDERLGGATHVGGVGKKTDRCVREKYSHHAGTEAKEYFRVHKIYSSKFQNNL